MLLSHILAGCGSWAGLDRQGGQRPCHAARFLMQPARALLAHPAAAAAGSLPHAPQQVCDTRRPLQSVSSAAYTGMRPGSCWTLSERTTHAGCLARA